jgi:hypothetical protein
MMVLCYAFAVFDLSVSALVTMKDLERPIADVLKANSMYSQPLMAKLADVGVDDLLGLCDLTVFIFVH